MTPRKKRLLRDFWDVKIGFGVSKAPENIENFVIFVFHKLQKKIEK